MIKISSICKSYEKNSVLDNITLEIPKNKLTVFYGPSGCGKSTLLNLIAGLIKSDSGKIENCPSEISYVFQEDKLLEWKTVLENINFVLKNPETHNEHLSKIFNVLEIEDKKNEVVKNLSGGQKQRVAIARAFAFPSEVVLMDEPFKSLDYFLRMRILNDFQHLLADEKRTTILVTHHLEEALLLADRIVLLNGSPVKVKKIIDIEINRKERKINSEYLNEVKYKIEDIFREKINV